MNKNHQTTILIIVFTISCLIMIYTLKGFTQSIPPYIHYQARLSDKDTGAPVNGEKTIRLSLYDSETGGIPIYFQTRDVMIDQGIFSVYLGKGEGNYDGNTVADGIPEEVFTSHSARYLGIKIEGSQFEMSPRQLMTSVAYAYKAFHANEAISANRAKEADEAAWASLGRQAGTVLNFPFYFKTPVFDTGGDNYNV